MIIILTNYIVLIYHNTWYSGCYKVFPGNSVTIQYAGKRWWVWLELEVCLIEKNCCFVAQLGSFKGTGGPDILFLLKITLALIIKLLVQTTSQCFIESKILFFFLLLNFCKKLPIQNAIFRVNFFGYSKNH